LLVDKFLFFVIEQCEFSFSKKKRKKNKKMAKDGQKDAKRARSVFCPHRRRGNEGDRKKN